MRLVLGAIAAVYLISLVVWIASIFRFRLQASVSQFTCIVGGVIVTSHALILLSLLVPGGHPPLVAFVAFYLLIIDLPLVPVFIVLLNIGYLRGERKAFVWSGFGYALAAAYLMYGLHLVEFFRTEVHQAATPVERHFFSNDGTARTRAIRTFNGMDEASRRQAVDRLVKKLSEGNRVLTSPSASLETSFSEIAPEVAGEISRDLRRMIEQGAPERLGAAYLLGLIHPPAEGTVPILIKALADPDYSVRLTAAYALNKMGVGTDPTLVEMLNGEDKDRKIAAATALSRKDPGVTKALPRLYEMLDDPDARVRQAAIYAVKELAPIAWDDKELIPALIRAMKSRDGVVRFAAVSALKEVGPAAADAAPELILLLKNGERAEAIVAAEVLGKMDRPIPEAVPILAAVVRNRSSSLWPAADLALRRMLVRIGTPEAKQMLDRMNRGEEP